MIQTPILILAVISQLILTLVPVGIKATSANIWEIGVVRLIIACGFLAFFFKKGILKDIKKSYLLGIFFFIHWSTYAYSVKVSSPSTAVIGLSFYGIILLFYSKFFLKKNIQPIFYFFMAIAFLSTRLVVEGDLELNGFIWGFISSIFYAFLPIINIKNKDIPANHRAFSQFFITLPFYLIFGFSSFEFQFDSFNWGILILLGIGGTLIGHGLWLKVTTLLPTTISGGFYYLAIPLAMIYEYLLLEIPVSLKKILGATLILFANLAILFYQKKESKQLSR